MTNRWTYATVRLAATGATLGTLFDAIHAYSGTTRYARSSFGRQAWWVPPLFGGAAVALGLSRPLAERMAGVRADTPSFSSVASAIGVFGVAYLASAYFPGGSLAKSAAIGACGGVAWWLCDRTPLAVPRAIVAAAGGVAVEAFLISRGEFVYGKPEVFGVAKWLPWLYACASVSVGALGSYLVERGPAA